MPPPLPDPATSSPLSSPDSFTTADATPTNPIDANVTDISTPDVHGDEMNYSKAKRLPRELKSHCQIYLEENLHILALRMLARLQSQSSAGLSGTIGQDGGKVDESSGIYCPPADMLAFLGTMTIHPHLTTRPKEPQWTDVSSAAMVYLRSLLQSAGPINARFQEAFRFGKDTRRSPTDGSDPLYEAGAVHGIYANVSVWRRGQDFFNTVGWAFNCSILYPNRWKYWRQWLEFMFDVMEADIMERARIDEEEHRTGGTGECAYKMLADSMLAGYINQCDRRRSGGGVKWLINVIFADGQTSSTRQFLEIWANEHRGPPKNRYLKRKRNFNMEKGDYGGLLDDESIYSSQASEPPTPQKRKSGSESPALEASYVESIALRQRLFYLLSYLCHFLPDPPFDLPDLYEFYEKEVRNLPLPIFTAFVDSTTSSLRTDSQISILQNLLILSMPSSAVKPSKVDPERYDVNGTSPAIIERCFLPYAANSIAAEDNAKVSVLLEEIIKLVWTVGTENFSDKLFERVTKGINAREAKIKKKVAGTRGRRNGQPQEDPDLEAKTLLEESSARLEELAELIMDMADDDDEGKSNRA
ncbi:hypothetical protein LQW54_007339 [Pestalotiopsis sp. IQ-011]